MSKVSSALIKRKMVDVELWSGHILGDKRPAYILLGSEMSKVSHVLIKKKMTNVELWSSHILGSYC